MPGQLAYILIRYMHLRPVVRIVTGGGGEINNINYKNNLTDVSRVRW